VKKGNGRNMGKQLPASALTIHLVLGIVPVEGRTSVNTISVQLNDYMLKEISGILTVKKTHNR
jgi:hypothetical protein